MHPDFWHARWQNGQIGWHLPHPNPLLAAHWEKLSVQPSASVYVPLCGKSEDLAWLHGQGYEVKGVELSPLALQQFFEAQKVPLTPLERPPFVVWQGSGYRLWQGDFFKLTPALLGQVDAVYDRAALVAFPPEMRARYVETLQQQAGKNTPFLLITLSADVPADHGPPFSVPDKEVERLYARCTQLERVASHTTTRKDEIWQEKVWIGRF